MTQHSPQILEAQTRSDTDLPDVDVQLEHKSTGSGASRDAAISVSLHSAGLDDEHLLFLTRVEGDEGPVVVIWKERIPSRLTKLVRHAIQ